MRARNRTLVATMIAVGLTAAVIPLVAGADAAAAGDLKWGDCADNDVVEDAEPAEIPKDLECAEVKVPIDRDDPDRSVAIQISRLPYTGEGDPKGSVTVVPGGPGGAGTSDLISAGETFKNLREHFNVVGYDPRGHYLDKNMPMDDCLYNGPEFAAPKTRKEFDKVHAKQRAAIDKCRDHDPELFDSLNSLTQAEDLDAVREAIGEEKLNAHATSYGGTIVQAYARTFPERVRTMYVDGASSHDQKIADAEKTYFEVREDLFGRFVKWCDGDADCALSGEDVPAVWQKLLADADKSPIPVPDHEGVSFNGHDLQGSAAILTNRDDRWPDLAEAIVEARDENKASIFGKLGLVKGRKAFSSARGVAVHCGDGRGYETYKQYREGRKRGERLSPNFPEVRVNRGIFCVGFDAPVSNPPAPMPGEKLPPILGAAAANEDDVHRITDQVPGSRLLRYEGYGHGLYVTGNECVIKHADRYFVDGTVPDEGVTCPKE